MNTIDQAQPLPGSSLAAPTGEAAMALPLSYVQESLWLVEQMTPGTAAYNLPEAWRLRGQLQPPALQAAFDKLLARHETLRTAFGQTDGKACQVIQEPASLALPLQDLRCCPDPEGELQRRLAAESRRPFDLGRAPLLRAILYHLTDQEHVLFINVHHLISDAWSQGVLLREVAELYAAEVGNRAPKLPELPIQYADFALWQREVLGGAAREKPLAYWKEKLRGPLPQWELPTDYARPGVQTYRGSTQFFTLPKALVDALKDLSRRQGVTLFMTLLAAFKTLLYRYTKQEDVIVGAPMAGRERVETENLIGFFVNTHALRTDLSGDPTFLALLSRVRETVLGAYAHQDVALETVVEAVQPERDLSRHALFQVVFGLQTSVPENWSLPNLEAQRMELDNGAAKFDWTLLFSETAQGLSGRCEFSTDLFEPGTMLRFSRQFQILLEGIVAAPEQRLSQLPLLTTAERQQLLVGWNQTASAYERDRCVHELFEQQAARHPDSIALQAQAEQLTYRELNARANQLARHLRRLGVGPEVPVAFCLERSPEVIVAMLAILKAGGAYVPLDRSYPPERLALMLQDTAAPVLVTDSRLDTAPLQVQSAKIICLDLEQTRLAQESAEDLPRLASPANLAYVMYTSGSTGTPKGAQIPHHGILRLVRHTNYLEFGPKEVFLQLAPVAFDASTLEIWGALLNGARLVIFPPHLPSLEELGRVLQQEKVTVLWLTAGLFHQMVDHQLEALQGVRYLLSGGDVLSVPHVLKVLREAPGCQLINGYGPTENTTFTTCYPVPAGWNGGRSVPIGRPISNTQVYVLDPWMQPAPIGVPGELYAGGDGLARGYLHQPELSAQKFVPNPFASTGSGAKLYRTGDRVRWLPDGQLEFLGRLDQQVKIRGYRVEPGEVEVVLGHHPALAQTVVVVRADKTGTKCLVAYFVTKPAAETSAAELRKFLEAKLPPYLVPAHFVSLPALPLTANGKVDRQALPEPEPSPGRAEPLVAPRDTTETLLAEIWREVLGLSHLGIHQNFFHLGGHSLLATQIISRVSHAFAIELPVRALFEAPTIARLAEAVRAAQQAQPTSPAIRPRQSLEAKAAALLERLDELSDAEVEQLLQEPELKDLLA